MGAPDIPGYRDFRLIGRGGSAEVFSAYQDVLDRQVAVKVMNNFEQSSAVLEREMRALAHLTEHTNIAQILDSGVCPDRRPYLVMPLYRRSLADLIAERGALDVETVLRMAVKLSGALQTLNEIGILHRDVKPSNVMLNRYGEVVLCDFGLAEFGGGAGTISGPVNGFTPVYAAPEVIEGSAPEASSDVYSLAATLYCCAAGRAPFVAGSVMQVLMQVINGPTPRLKLGPADDDFADLIEQAMARDPKLRPTAGEFGMKLQSLQLQRGLPITEMASAAASDIAGSGLSLSAPPRHAAEPPGPSAPAPADAEPWSPPAALPNATWSPLGDAEPWSPPGELSAAEPWSPPPDARFMPSPASHSSRTAGADETAGPAFDPERTVIVSGRVRTGTGFWLRRRLAAVLLLPLRLVARALVEAVRLVRRTQTPPQSSLQATASWLGSVSADRPTAVDQLGHAPLMEGLAQVLNDPGTALPITLAVCGQWGSGKSSLMLQLADRLCRNPSPQWRREWLAVHFDAWRFQGREALWAGVARAIYKQAATSMPPTARLRFRLKLERLRRGTPRFAGGIAVALASAGFVVWSVVIASLGTRSWLTFTGLAAGAAALTAATSYIGALREPFERAIARGSVTKKFDEFLGISDQAEHDIECLLDAIVARGERRCLIVFFDDLDRCQSALITEALAAITEIFGRHEGRQIAFVLGVDLDVVTSAVDTSLAELRERMHRLNARRASEMSEQFLEKVFQLSVSVDGHRRQRVEQLLFGGMNGAHDPPIPTESGSEVAQAIAGLSVQNPADITQARHDAGINTGVVPDADIRVLRAAVRARRSSLLSVESEDVRSAEQAVIASLSMTPRAAKRFDNAFRLQLQVANSTPGSELSYDAQALVAIAKWVALRMFFPSIIRLIDRRPGMLGELEEALAGDRESAAFHSRISELDSDITPEAIADLSKLLRVNLPGSEIATLPLDSFATTTM